MYVHVLWCSQQNAKAELKADGWKEALLAVTRKEALPTICHRGGGGGGMKTQRRRGKPSSSHTRTRTATSFIGSGDLNACDMVLWLFVVSQHLLSTGLQFYLRQIMRFSMTRSMSVHRLLFSVEVEARLLLHTNTATPRH